MHILIIGGTRFIGRALVESLAARGHNVTIFSRGSSRPLFPSSVKAVWGNRDDGTALERVFSMDTYDVIFDNIAHRDSDVRLLHQVAGGCLTHYFLMSTAWVYLTSGKFKGHLYSEKDLTPESIRFDSSATPENPSVHEVTRKYIQNKLAAENFALEMNCPVTIIRPSMVSGADDHLRRISFYAYRILRHEPIYLIDGRARRYQVLWINDLVKAIIMLMEVKLDGKQIINIGPSEPIRVQDILSVAEKTMDREAQRVLITRGELASMGIDFESYDPFGHEIDIACDSAKLLSYIPEFRFTPATQWISQTVIQVQNRWDGSQNGSDPDMVLRNQKSQ